MRNVCRAYFVRKDARVVEEARLESVYTSKAYRGFESPSFRRDLKLYNFKIINYLNNNF